MWNVLYPFPLPDRPMCIVIIEAKQLSTFVRGLIPSNRAFVFSKKPQNFHEALNAATLAVSVHLTANESASMVHTLETSHSLESKLDCLVDTVKKTNSPNVAAMSTNYVDSPIMSGQRKCRTTQTLVIQIRCGRLGHKWRQCYAM